MGILKARIEIFASLPIAGLDGLALKQKLAEIGHIEDAPRDA